MDPARIMEPIFQYGFAGFAAILLGILVWLISRLLGLLKSTTDVINKNTEAIHALGELGREDRHKLDRFYERLCERPCLMRGNERGRSPAETRE